MSQCIAPVNRDTIRKYVRSAQPFPHFMVENFLEPDFANAVVESFPSFQEAKSMGKTFRAVNERDKVQVTDSSRFPEPIRRLNEELASQDFLDFLSYVMDIPKLLADDQLEGGGIHETGPRGFLDVHVDFNYIAERDLHRRLNILIYFNKDWKDEWGGNIELWDKQVKHCGHSFSPTFNRCVVFETSDISYHGVTAVKCPEGVSRKSFAAYYYTKEAPAHWTGESHSTIFKARPNEKLKGSVLMPAQRVRNSVREGYYWARGRVRKLVKG